jgi:hypothetical protein
MNTDMDIIQEIGVAVKIIFAIGMVGWVIHFGVIFPWHEIKRISWRLDYLKREVKRHQHQRSDEVIDWRGE